MRLLSASRLHFQTFGVALRGIDPCILLSNAQIAGMAVGKFSEALVQLVLQHFAFPLIAQMSDVRPLFIVSCYTSCPFMCIISFASVLFAS
jgi:hypothetical protein